MADRALYYGDNLEILRKYAKDESVDLCYMDPPFNSQKNYNQIYNNTGGEDQALAQAFIDTWKWDERARSGFAEILSNPEARFTPQLVELIRGLHRVLGEGSLFAYMVGMSLRLTEIHRTLKPTGSFYLHCDPTSSHYLKLAVDSVFLPRGGQFQNEIVWRRTGAHAPQRSFGPVHDTLLFYTKSVSTYYFNIVLRPYMRGHIESRYTKDDKTGLFKFTSGGNVLTGAGLRSGESGKKWRQFDPTAKGRHWAVPGFLAEQMPPDFGNLGVIEKLDALYEAKLIDISPGVVWPTPVRFLREGDGSAVSDMWAYQPYTEGTVHGTSDGIDADVQWLGPKAPERLGYPTQKPIGLLKRIIESSCPADGIVLDPCCGCGTTIAAAEQLNRRWIGIDITYQSISLILQRLEDQAGEQWPTIEKSIAITGIPKDMASAVALAHKKDDRVRKEFEKWAVLTYTNNRALINEKKGADAGIDGRVYFLTGKTEGSTMVLQVKSGLADRGDVAKLRGDMEREGAAMATLITLAEPTGPMLAEAKAAGLYHHELMDRDYNRIEIVTVREMIEENRRLNIPLVKAAKPAPRKGKKPEQELLPGVIPPEPEQTELGDMLTHLKVDVEDRKPPRRADSRKQRESKKSDTPSETKKKKT